MLSEKEETYKLEGKIPRITPSKYKKDFPFLMEVDSLALANVQLDLEGAYKSFFEGVSRKPRFKSKKKSRKSYTTNNQKGTVSVTDKSITSKDWICKSKDT